MKYTEYARQCSEGKILAALSDDIQENINRCYDDVDENFDFKSNPELHPDYFVKNTLMKWSFSDVFDYAVEKYGLDLDDLNVMEPEEVVAFVECDYFWLGEQDGIYYFLKG